MRSFLVIAILANFISAKSQNPKQSELGPQILFSKTTHDFGRVNEEVHFAKCRFTFVNNGDAPLYITSVQTSCGCTTPDWTRDTIQPGDSGFVDAKYETTNRMGTFRKTISVYSNAKNSPFVHLDIIGEVYKEAMGKTGMEIPNYGQVFFDPATVDFNPIYDNTKDTQFVRVVNGTPFSTSFGEFVLPANVKIIGMPRSLEPNESVKIQVVLDGTAIAGYGFGATSLPVTCDNPVSPNVGLYLAYTRKQYFPKMSSKQLSKAPKISFEKEIHNFGDMNTGDIRSTTFVVSNKGKSDLVLREVFPECTCLKVQYDKKVLKPGEKMNITVTYDSINKKGQSTQSIWIVSNDPTRDEMKIYIRAKLPEKAYHCPTCH